MDSRSDVIMTGIGGQGVQLCSKVLASAAAAGGRHVMLSSYFGGQIRGGRTEATMIVRDSPIDDLPPIVPRLNAMIVLHPEYLANATPRLTDNPLVVADAWVLSDDAYDGPADAVPVPAREIAADLGVPIAAGFALIGAFAALTGVATPAALDTAVRDMVPAHRVAALQANLDALTAGAEAVQGTPVGISR